MTQGLRRDKTRPAHLLTGHTGTKLTLQRPFIGTSGTKLALHTIKRQCWALFRLRGEYSHARSLTKQSRAKIVTHRARQHKHSKETSPLCEVLRAVVKHFSPTHVHKSQFWPFSTEQGRCFFHCGCMPGTGAIRWGDISFRTRPRRPIEPPILTHRTRDQQTGGTGVMGTEGHGRGRGAGGRQHGQNKHTRPQAPPDWRPPRGLRGQAAVPVGGGRARAGLEIDHSEPSGSRVAISRAGRRPPAHTAASPIKAGHTAPGNQVAPGTPAALNELRHRKRKAYSPRNALIAGISRTACTRPAR